MTASAPYQPIKRGAIMRVTALTICIMSLLPVAVRAAPCDRLTAAQRKLSAKIFRTTHPYECCDETLDRCLAQIKVCKLAKRLRDDICRRIVGGQDEKKIRNALDRRARSMSPAIKKASFDLRHAPPAGSASAPVTVVVYACARCPFCSKVVPDLHRLVIRGGLRGKVKLHFRPFPIRGHKGSAEGGLAIVAASRLGKLWPYLLKLFAEYNQYSSEKLPQWATQVGMDRKAFLAQMALKANRKLLIQSKKEGLRNGVRATPTLFINGRQYYGDMDRESLLDVLDEEADRVGKRQFCGKK